MSNLAISGGPKVRTELFPDQNTIDEHEIDAVKKVMQRGRLSGYRGNWCPEFYGGPTVQELEKTWAERFCAKHAIAVNSATSGLHVACGALGLQPGDEVIVSPYSMTCSATSPMIYGALPVFADIEPDFFCLDPKCVEAKITSKTKAIIPVSLFGQPYDPEINDIARRHNLLVIEDAAQALGSFRKADGKAAGTFGHIGIFSFNYGKHLTCGEGGMIVTDDDELALYCRLIRNHAEAVINGMPDEIRLSVDTRTVGFNMRMTEVNAAIVIEQLKKQRDLQFLRDINSAYLIDGLRKIPAIAPAPVRPGFEHTYYALPFLWDSTLADGIHRDVFINAVKAELTERKGREGEGVPIGCGYITPLYKMPLFDFPDGLCPVCERLSYHDLFLTLYHAPNSTLKDIDDVIFAFKKVWENRADLV